MPSDKNFTLMLEFGGKKVSATMAMEFYIDRHGRRLDSQRLEYVRDPETVEQIRKDHGQE